MNAGRKSKSKPEVQYILPLSEYVPSTYVNGKEWERDFAELCKQRGFRVTMSSPTCEYDMLCNGFRVQCKKTEFVDQCGNFGRIRLSRGSGCSAANNYNADAFDVFAIWFDSQCFIVPVSEVGCSNGKMKRRFSVGALPRFKDNWGFFAGQGATSQQMELF